MDTNARPEPPGLTQPTEPQRSGGPVRPAVIGIGVFAAIAAILLAIFLLQPDPEPVGGGDPSPTLAPASVTPEPSESAASSAAPTAEPSPSGPATVPDGWTDVASFAEPGRRYTLGDLVAWSDGLVAVGTRYDDEARSVFGPPPPHAGRVWRSTDGTSWTDATPDGTFDQVELMQLFETNDGALIVIGAIWDGPDPRAAAWESDDGEAWAPVQLDGIPADYGLTEVASGARGHMSGGHFSADGRTWEETIADVTDVAAGDEGFVATTFPEGAETGQIVASSDGLEWFDATEPDDGSFLAAPRGGDWIATTTTFGDGAVSVATWGSANGLDWSRLGEMELESVEMSDTSCPEVPGVLHGLQSVTIVGTTLGACGEGAVVAAGGSYASVDGAEWTRLPFGDQAYAAGAVMVGDRIVIATDARTNQADVMGVTFWISEP
jgi:hypothetical protein